MELLHQDSSNSQTDTIPSKTQLNSPTGDESASTREQASLKQLSENQLAYNLQTIEAPAPKGLVAKDNLLAFGNRDNPDGVEGVRTIEVFRFNGEQYAPVTTIDLEALDIVGNADPIQSAIADFNGDGDLDIATALSGQQAQVFIFYADGQGGFSFTPQTIDAGDNLRYVDAADFDFDGDEDLVVAAGRSDRVEVYANDGSGSFSLFDTAPVTTPWSVQFANLDDTGDLEIAATDVTNDEVVILGFGPGGLQEVGRFASGAEFPYGTDAEDINGDGRDDLLVGNGGLGSGDVSAFLNTGNYTFSESWSSLDGRTVKDVALFEYEGELRLALAVGADTPYVFASNGDGTFTDLGFTESLGLNQNSVTPTANGVAWASNQAALDGSSGSVSIVEFLG